MSNEETEKMTYINENIIEKGYDPEDVANFAMKHFGLPFDKLSLEKLKTIVEQYKDKGLNDAYKTIKLNENKKKEIKENSKKNDKSLNVRTPLYSPESYEFETNCQQENKLMELYRNNNFITITVSEPQKEGKNGIFSKSYMSYRIQCPQLNSDVRRTYADFEWFRSKLVLRYPFRVIPPIMKENVLNKIGNVLKLESEELKEEKKLRYLNQFMDCLTKKKILRTSPILQEFLLLNNELFKKYQNKLNNKSFELSISLDNFITMKGKIKCELKENSLEEANKSIIKYNSFIDIYKKMDSYLSDVVVDLNNLNNHMNKISLLFNKLNENITQYQCNNSEDMKNVFSNFEKMFKNWSTLFGNQREYFNKDFKETINYLNLEMNEMTFIYKKYIEFKNDYETFTEMIYQKKEKLFASKKIENWGVEPGTEEDIPIFIDDKKQAFEKMLYKENIFLKEEKKRVTAAMYLMSKQFDKLMKNQSERLKKFYDLLKENSKNIFGNEQLLSYLTN
jgi:hypothetical protein